VPPSSERQLGNEPTRAPGVPTLSLVLAADWISPSVARDRVRAWLKANQWSPAHTDDLVLAVNEAVSNSIEHGYQISQDDPPGPQTIEVDGVITRASNGIRHAKISVRDTGSWVPPTVDEYSTRGQGIRLMRACVEHLTIDGTSDGTTVVLQRSMGMPA
jgi:serine/threonine-protein kinase RsbW